MKRSQINTILDNLIAFASEHKVYFPEFANWTTEDVKNAGPEYQEIFDNMLGWDVTDFGSDDFAKRGLATFTFRNGNFNDKKTYPKPYCEKILILEDGQELPMHFHKIKEEDTINRGGGILDITVYNATADEQLDKESGVHLVKDGKKITVPAGGVVSLEPGESVTMTQRIYHRWMGRKGTGKIMVWEVSSSNDDNVDNRFFEPVPRFSNVDEDEPIRHVLFADYPTLRGNK
ncbi:D-lyxose/D-mannose family sugar isomerase [Furfurilactobacillus milii]|uniref:D-lyxose/D-mannose family sugar isomerase n=1 Tax=Furfurilactobacillus milii TaxID=2888272 RepID=UPI001F181553|nr:D-lyxose/D-mannose family sugar isomerase [Furfurilactobacillus milii]MCF6418423.1 D-lyxose/D-mannose family sugar isomerase [Furfurilactobacillus milii]